MARIYHIATAADWAEARRTGSYTTSTIGRTLEEEGFIHASRREQVLGVWQAFYAGAREPLVLLTIDTSRLDAEVRDEPVGDDTYPHIYGPIATRTVVSAQPLNRRGGTESFSAIYVREVFARIWVLILAMALSVVGHLLWDPWGALVGLALGMVAAWLILRRRG